VHVYLNGTFTDALTIANLPIVLTVLTERDCKFAIMGGKFFMVSINWLLFIAGLSGFWTSKKKKFPPEHQLLPACRNKTKWRERMGHTFKFR
jgi:hypothetical protein